MSIKLSIVVPVYRSQPTLRELHRRIVAAVEAVEPAFEIILVEDCEGDASWPVIEALTAKNARVRGIKLSRNFGQLAATICGISKACERRGVANGIREKRAHDRWRNSTSQGARKMLSEAQSCQ